MKTSADTIHVLSCVPQSYWTIYLIVLQFTFPEGQLHGRKSLKKSSGKGLQSGVRSRKENVTKNLAQRIG